MKSLEDFNQTLSRLNDAIFAIERSDNYLEISKLEMEAVRILQLLEFQVGTIGQEMYEYVKDKRNRMQRGETIAASVATVEETHEDNKRSNSGRAKRQSNSKTKRASK